MASVSGGRFDFDDGGTYCGGWEDGKAHGHGVCTGPKSQGEYSGSWHFGFEVSGVYTWPSGSTYEGQWQNGKRHGLGVETRGRWTYRGEWTQGFKGRYGVRQSLSSGARYEGTWANGLQDGYGSETYADGGTFQGQWMRGMRHGYGSRTSATFGAASQQRPASVVRGSLSSLPVSEDPAGDRDRKMDDFRGGFVLKSRSCEPPARRRSLVEKSNSLKKSILQGLKLKKQRSTGDIDRRGGASSIRSSGSNLSSASSESGMTGHSGSLHTDSNASFVSQDGGCDAHVTETYLGEWKNDRRCGFGVAERSDGLKYEGEWYNNKKYGYGVTTLKDGSREEGKYKNNVLVSSGKRRHLFALRSSKFKERVEAAVAAAHRASQIALQKADIAISRTATARGKAEQADVGALHAQEDSNIARLVAKQFDPDAKVPEMPRNKFVERPPSRIPFANLSNQTLQSPDPPLGSSRQNLAARTASPPQIRTDQYVARQNSLQHKQDAFAAHQDPRNFAGHQPLDRYPQQQQQYPQQQQQQQYLPPQTYYQEPPPTQYPAYPQLQQDPPVVPNRQGSIRPRGADLSLQQAMGDHFDHYRQEAATPRPRHVIKHGRRVPSPQRPDYRQPRSSYGGGPDATPDSGVSESMDEASPARRRPYAESLLSYAPSEAPSLSPTVSSIALSEAGSDASFPRTASLYVSPPSRGAARGPPAGEAFRRKKSMPHGPREMAAAAPQRVVPREEVAFLSSQRREEVRRMQHEADRLRSNPLLYLVRPDLKDWFSRQQMIMLVLFINISLAVFFYRLLS